MRQLAPLPHGRGWGWVFLCLLIFNLASCDTFNCLLDTKVECGYGFYAEGTSIAVSDTLTVTALGIDSVLVNRQVNKSSLKLPVSYYGDVDSLEFKIQGPDGEARDTVYMAKRNIGHIEDVSCPAHMWHTITSVYSTHHLIDSVYINNADINYDGLENLQIYFRTAEE